MRLASEDQVGPHTLQDLLPKAVVRKYGAALLDAHRKEMRQAASAVR